VHTLEVLLSRLSRMLPWQAGPGNRTVSMLITNLPAWPPFRFLRQGVEARPIGNAVGTAFADLPQGDVA